MWINYAHAKVDLDILQALADINDRYPCLEIKRLKRFLERQQLHANVDGTDRYIIIAEL